MQRILVIDDVGLWISLNRHFAGDETIRISEIPSFESGLRLAGAEQPDLVVCPADGESRSPDQVARHLRRAGLETQLVLCVFTGAKRAGTPPNPDVNLSICAPDRFTATVDRLLEQSNNPHPSAELDLLAHFELLSTLPGEPSRGFMNLRQINTYELVLECSTPLATEDQLALTFHLPRTERTDGSSERFKIGLRCRIHRCLDAEKMIFSASIQSVDANCRDMLTQFIEGGCRGADGH